MLLGAIGWEQGAKIADLRRMQDGVICVQLDTMSTDVQTEQARIWQDATDLATIQSGPVSQSGGGEPDCA